MRLSVHNCAGLISVLCLLFSLVANATDRAVTMDDIEALEAQLAQLKARFLEQNKRTLSANKAPQDKTAQVISAQQDKAAPLVNETTKVDVYATIRPTFGLIDEQTHSNWDVRDALSHAGLKVSHEFQPGWSAQLHGEWGIDLANEGNFGKSRRAYTALSTPYGRFGIGKQRPAQYLFIAEYVDIFNHSSSPFAYDPESIFFVDNLLSYRFETGPLTFVAVGQFDGNQGDKQTDLFNAGVSYDAHGLHAALTYQQNDIFDKDVKLGHNRIWASSFAYQFTNRFYGAVSYQNKDYARNQASLSRSGHTFDLSLAYQFADRYKLKTGIFDFDDGYNHFDTNNQSFDGYNVTLEWLPTKPLRVHLEYLNKSFDNQADMQSISVGFRYDYKQQWQYE
ncbi:porin [Pseudoalteromonas sp. JBTF-M23]|uniref:Porin n=1 Tax=Pseudoalteromonas caenipelagi TaxID=2726988 RepID=A0A849VFK3_9GAMM|nr:porin [Pseudoalteromonas caenipelagi]NOU50507.1 porin [Pseudoalteromonas caenipelagi]